MSFKEVLLVAFSKLCVFFYLIRELLQV